MQDYGDVIRLRLGTRPAHAVFHPDHVRWVLQENHKNYTKQTPGYATLKLFMGNGLLTSDGDFWRRQRRIAQPAFHRERLAGLGAMMALAADEAAARIHGLAKSGRPFDVAAEMMRITLRIVGETLFGVNLSAEAAVVQKAIRFLQEDANRRTSSVFTIPLRFPTPKNRELVSARATLDAILWKVVSERRRAGIHAADLLGMLMDARDEETGESMSDEQLRDEVMTMFLAGHESTANALTWTWYLLSLHPAVERTLQEELAGVLGGRTPAVEDLPKLAYCKAVLQESMRLYPPAWSVGRAPIEDDRIGGYSIPSGHVVIIVPYATHRHPGVWENPEGFEPGRFLGESGQERARSAYFPFGAGPRVCIGSGFAMMEAQLVLATIAQRVRLDLVPGHPIELEPLITLRPRFGMKMTAHERVRS
jgi:cytochrome P450